MGDRVPPMTPDQERQWPWKFFGVPISEERYHEIELSDDVGKKAWKAFYLNISQSQGRSAYSGQRRPF